jgi:hypothetical protein
VAKLGTGVQKNILAVDFDDRDFFVQLLPIEISRIEVAVLARS